MANAGLVVQVREQTGKGVARKLRAAGRIPGVLYGRGKEPRSLQLDPHEVERLLKRSDAGMNTLIDLTIEGDSAGRETVLVKELQRDPVGDVILHADLYVVDLTKTIEVEVPVHLTGTPVGVSVSGGILDHTLRDLLVECLPTAIPDAITLDVSGLEIGDSVHVRDVQLPEGVTMRSDADLSIAGVAAPTVEEEETPEVAEGEEGVVAEGEEGAVAEGEEGAAPAEGKAKDEGADDKSTS